MFYLKCGIEDVSMTVYFTQYANHHQYDSTDNVLDTSYAKQVVTR